MNRLEPTKINLLLQNWPKGIVAVDSWLQKQGISKSLKHHYIKTAWFESIGNGAVIRKGESVTWRGGLWALQQGLMLPVHIGGKSALNYRGLGHFIEFATKKVTLYSPQKILLPTWFSNYDWKIAIEHIKSDFLPNNLHIEQKDIDNLPIRISAPERAILEVLYLVPEKQSFEESSLLIENLVSLRPHVIEELLNQCRSIKVKRLFLFLAEKMNYSWYKRINLDNVNLGSGKRSIIKGGVLDLKYNITVPRV